MRWDAAIKKWDEQLGFAALSLCMCAVTAVLVIILWDIFSKGGAAVTWEFVSQSPRNGMTQGGIFPAIVGTVAVTSICAALSIPLGVGCAIYLNEYAAGGFVTRLVRMSIRNLSGVPSIVYGLFGVVLFVQICHLGTSILAAGLTLGLMTLPVTITASEEALKCVPKAYRDGALALGATKWQAIRTVVLPQAIPGMLTGAILGLARAAGETAPILFTGAAFFLPALPKSWNEQFMALPYHLYVMATQHQSIVKVRPLAYGTALVLIAVVLGMNICAILLRAKLRQTKVRT